MKITWLSEPEEFFVGYLPKAPRKTASFLRWVILGIGAAAAVLGIVIAKAQSEFSSADFEYGKYSTIEGSFFKAPIPHIQVVDSIHGINKTILLVGFGKAGAAKTIEEFEAQIGAIDKKQIKLTGQLIHGHCKALLQISADMLPDVIDGKTNASLQLKDIGEISVVGEITDPKCYFGVMKPGEGKPHRSCAIRCISGGIPPVFRTGFSNDHYLLLDENLEPINSSVLDFIGDEITLTGKTVQMGEWKILLIEKNDLQASYITASPMRNQLAMDDDGMTICSVR